MIGSGPSPLVAMMIPTTGVLSEFLVQQVQDHSVFDLMEVIVEVASERGFIGLAPIHNELSRTTYLNQRLDPH